MKKVCWLLAFIMTFALGAPALGEGFGALIPENVGDTAEYGPYTVEKLAEGLYHIEDGVEAYKPGLWTNEDGTLAYDENGNFMNNCSDMYLILGETGALLIDLSNKIDRDDAENALAEICAAIAGDLPLEVAITHGHGDHVGMAGAFPDSVIWMPAGDYADYFGQYYGLTRERVTMFTPGEKAFDLGGRNVSTVLVQGHTKFSTVFAIDGEGLMFSGDAIGSGGGVWIWGADGLANYKLGMANFMQYILQNVDEPESIKIYGGHAWQYGKFVEGGAEYLDWQYVKDMFSCINLLSEGAWVKEGSGLTYQDWGYVNSGLTGDFVYGTAGISAALEAACDYAGITAEGKVKANYPWGAALKYDDKIAMGVTYAMGEHLDLFEERTYASGDEAVGDLTYYVYDPIANGADPDGVYPVLYWFHGAGNALDGKIAIAYGGAELFASEAYQATMGGAYIICPMANEYRNERGGNEGTWMTPSADGSTSMYSAALKGLIDLELANFGDNAGKLILSGTSAGGYCVWRYMIDHTEDITACLVMAGAYLPTEAELDKLEAAGVRIWMVHAYYDELVSFDRFIRPILDRLLTMENVELSIFKWVRNGAGYISSLPFGIEMGQHCICNAVGGNLIYDDGTPYDISHPDGVTGWIRDIVAE